MTNIVIIKSLKKGPFLQTYINTFIQFSTGTSKELFCKGNFLFFFPSP